MTPDHPLLSDEAGRSEFLLGNEAIARGAIEAGVGFACGYPGTPSTEVTDTFARLAPLLGIPFEYSVNEKVALEMAFAASLAGTRSIVAMKHLGLMYAGDPLSTIPYVGAVAGMVIVSAGDPSMHTSPNEQDQRHLADTLHIPMLDPRTPQEALEITRFAFELSERSRLPVIVRPTTRVCHGSAPVTFGPRTRPVVHGFKRDAKRFQVTPSNASRMRTEIADRLESARSAISDSGFFEATGTGRTGVLTTGAAAAICADLLADAGEDIDVTLMAMGIVYPLPEGWLIEKLRDMDTVIVVEELSPYLEDRIRALCSLNELPPKILGKRTGHFPTEFEYTPEIVQSALHDVLGMDPPVHSSVEVRSLPIRPPTLCAACPHRSAFFAARSVFGDGALYFNDIGCYTLGAAPPLNAGDAILAMGAGFSLAAGVARTTGERTLGFLGDGTFFHSGMPALLNAIKENANMVAVIMDNEVTAMTGFQESPGVKIEAGRVRRTVDIEAVVRALGAPHVETVDPNDLASSVGAFERAKARDELSVVISQRPCPVHLDRAIPDHDEVDPGVLTYAIDHDRCKHCGRSSCGQRCDQDVVEDYERAMVRARSLEVGEEVDRPPVAPCADKCPLFLCIQGYSAHIAAGRYGDALELIMDGLPLPDSVCRVCHRPCESACVRTDQPVAINDLKRFVMDWADEQEVFPNSPQPPPANGMSVGIVGAGPAGLAAAHDLAMRGFEVRLFDADQSPGGVLASGIPAYRLPSEVLNRDIERILGLGVIFEGGRRLGTDLDIEELVESHDAVLLAVGAGTEIDLDLPGRGPEVVQGLRYLRTDVGPAERVLVVGGGNTAIDAARTALRRGAEHVVIACLEDRTDMPAIGSEIIAADDEGVEIHTRVAVTALVGDGVEMVKVAPLIPGATDPENFEPVAGTDFVVGADLVVTAIGQRPDPSTPERRVVDNKTGRTSHEAIFAAGDMADGGGSVTDAIAGGLRAAWGIDRSLRGEVAADERPPPPMVTGEAPSRRSGVSRVDITQRAIVGELDPTERVRDFGEVVGALTEPQARAEAARCMICGLCGNCNACLDLFGCPAFFLDQGKIEIDPLLCVSCGVCAQFCPNNAIYPVTQPTGTGERDRSTRVDINPRAEQ